AKQQGVDNVYVHAFLDGRDMPPKSAKPSLEKLQERGTIATVSGRFYAMDRDNRWERVKLAYDAIANTQGLKANSALQALEQAYERNETDEFVKPTVIHPVKIQPGDVIIYLNFRADRARALTNVFTNTQFSGFERPQIALGEFVTLTEYDKNFPV